MSGELLDVHTVFLAKIDRKPGDEHPPDGVKEETAENYGVALPAGEKFSPTESLVFGNLALGLAIYDVFLLLVSNPRMLLRAFLIENQPGNNPERGQDADCDEGPFPAEGGVDKTDQNRGEDGSDGSSGVEEALCGSPFFLGGTIRRCSLRFRARDRPHRVRDRRGSP